MRLKNMSKENRFALGLNVAFFLLSFIFCAGIQYQAQASQYDEPAEVENYFTTRMGSSLWETLIDQGINPTLWKFVFEYNRTYNPAFARITSAKRIPRNTVIYIPYDRNDTSVRTYSRTGSRPGKATVQDTVALDSGLLLLEVKAGRGQRLNDVIKQFCIPTWMKNNGNSNTLLRNVRSDIRDIYRRIGRQLNYRDRSFLIPMHLLSERFEAFQRKYETIYGSPEGYVSRDSMLEVPVNDIRHVAAEGESYRSVAKLYLGNADIFPKSYPYRKSHFDHISYMVQHIRHYNLNQQFWPGKVYYIPEYLLEGRYYGQNPEVKLERKTKKALYYKNGLKISLAYHVTRRKAYWKRRQKYLTPLRRQFTDGTPAYPDMIIWHRTGLEPEVEEVLRSKGRKQFSIRYIYRMAATNYYIDESGNCFLIVDPEKNPRDHAGHGIDFRCFWNGLQRVSDVSVGIEIEGGFLSVLSRKQLETARKLQEVIRGRFIIPDERVLDHKKVACRRGPDLRLLRGRKADGLTASDRVVIGVKPVLDPDVLRGIVEPNLNDIMMRQADSTDYWYKVEIDPDLEESARRAGWQLSSGLWLSPHIVMEIKDYSTSE